MYRADPVTFPASNEMYSKCPNLCDMEITTKFHLHMHHTCTTFQANFMHVQNVMFCTEDEIYTEVSHFAYTQNELKLGGHTYLYS